MNKYVFILSLHKKVSVNTLKLKYPKNIHESAVTVAVVLY